MKINYENILYILQEELNKIRQYSDTIEIYKLLDRIEQLQYDNTTYDGNDDLPF